MVTRILLLGVTAGFLLGECVSLPVRDFGRLDVLVYDSFGTRLKQAKVEILGKTHIDANRVPFGANELRVSESGFVSVWRSETITQKNTVVRVVLEVGAEEECGARKGAIGGQIRGMRGGEELWVTAIPVRGRGGEEAMVTPSGKFLIPGLATGDYIVLVQRGDQVIESRTQRVGRAWDDGQEMIVDLAVAKE